jgi:hypothetical protein
MYLKVFALQFQKGTHMLNSVNTYLLFLSIAAPPI